MWMLVINHMLQEQIQQQVEVDNLQQQVLQKLNVGKSLIGKITHEKNITEI